MYIMGWRKRWPKRDLQQQKCGENLVNIPKDELLNFTTNDHAYFCDLPNVGAEEEVDKKMT